jgi:hypothetical protein
MVESKLVELVVAGSSPVGHPIFFTILSFNVLAEAAAGIHPAGEHPISGSTFYG